MMAVCSSMISSCRDFKNHTNDGCGGIVPIQRRTVIQYLKLCYVVYTTYIIVSLEMLNVTSQVIYICINTIMGVG